MDFNAADDVRRRVLSKDRGRRRAAVEAMQAEIRDLTKVVKGAGLRLSLLAGQVNVMLIEMQQDDTTVFIKRPDPPQR